MNHSSALLAPGPLPASARAFLDNLQDECLLAAGDVDRFLQDPPEPLERYTNPEALGAALIQAGLLTAYQLGRIRMGQTHGLVLGNYRVLDRIGAGAMGVVYRAEHQLMKRHAAIKVLPVDDQCPPAVLERFYSEMCVLAELHHPHIVMALDAGQIAAAGPQMPALLYLVMELVPGGDLEQWVQARGPLPIAEACEYIRQAASGLQEAHDRHLIHRDVKPSNLLRTESGKIKVVDFGLARQFCSRLTDPQVLLGTLDCMAPEQSWDPSTVDSPVDIYGLGATLFFLLTGEMPYPAARSVGEALRMLQCTEPRRLRALRPGVPAEIDALVTNMMNREPSQRPSSPLAIMNALLPYSGETGLPRIRTTGTPASASQRAVTAASGSRPRRVLIVDDESSIRVVARAILEPLACLCAEARDGARALAMVQEDDYDLVLLDLNLPDMDGYELCRRLRETSGAPALKIIIISGRGDHNLLADALSRGADDYIPKPFGARQLEARVRHALELKVMQERADFLARQLQLTNVQMEQSLAARTSDVQQAQNALLFAMAKMAESREGETAGHLRRLQRYCRCLVERAADWPNWAGLSNRAFSEQLERCVPLHDIGKIGLPEHLLLKPGKLSAAERSLMETHTIIGDRILQALGQEHGASLAFMGMARAIVRHHHERFDGSGYPDHLAGEAIPAAARITAVADVYDALRRQRFHKSALPHTEACRIIQTSQGQFDPELVEVFTACEREFEQIYREIST